MKILVLGSSGMVGHVVAIYLEEVGYQVLGYDNELLPGINTIIGESTDFAKIEKIINNEKPDVIVNCTAVINEKAEKDKCDAVLINSYLPHFLEKVTSHTSIKIIHRSTDCIFSGKKGAYSLDDLPDAPSFYARTKTAGELINDKDITIRTSLIGPELNGNNESLLGWFISQTSSVNGYKNAIWTGITTLEFAKEIDLMIQSDCSGIYQCVPAKSISKYELLMLFNKYVKKDIEIRPFDNTMVDKSLIQILPRVISNVPSYEDMMKEMYEWIVKHPNLYINYLF